MLRLTGRLAIVVAVACVAAEARAQLHAASSDRVVTTELDVLAFHRDGRTELIVRRAYAADAPPNELAWVIPTPSRALAAAEASGDPFDELSVTVGEDREEAAAPVRVDARYHVQRLEGRGPDAVTALRRWLADGGFEPIPSQRTDYYAQRGWSFVVARVSAADGLRLPRAGRLPPLHVAFASERAVVPLRLEGPAAVALRLFVWTDTAPVPELTGGALDRGLVGVGSDGGVAWRRLAEPPPTLAEVARAHLARPPQGSTHLALLRADALGRGAADPSGWPEDLSLPALEGDGPLTAFAQVALPRSDEDGSVARRRAPIASPAGCGCRVGGGAGEMPLAALALAALATWRGSRRRG